ncbi:MAG: DUF2304 domain-containing protein [Lachnospiraceae bacterium]|nr:DUF2304 domain-containing protein [Lachnospiraceae bacterium]
MNLRLQLVVAVVIILAMIYITNKVRKKQVELKYALLWYALGLIYLLFDLIPPLQTGICQLLGITVPINMLIFLAIGLILLIIFQQMMIVSKQAKTITRLTQEIGILNEELMKTREKDEVR